MSEIQQSELIEGYGGIFDIQAEMGFTKHMGSLGATIKLLELCHINKHSYVLDVGCGVGATPCFIAKRYGCNVVAVDISEKMVARSKERAKRKRVEHLIEFRIADAQELPFRDNTFNIVITESVTAFPEDRQKAVDEYARVTKPGGYIGLSETTLKKAAPKELTDYMFRTSGMKGELLTFEYWKGLLENAGLEVIIANAYEISALKGAIGTFRRYGFRHMLKLMYKLISLYRGNPSYREFVKEAKNAPKNMAEYFGYGLYVGKKT